MSRLLPVLVSLSFMMLGLALAPLRPLPAGAEIVASIAAVPVCHGATRTNCVVDGDTLWLFSEKIRIAGIDAPEVKGACGSERERARLATLRLAELLAAGPMRVERQGLDRYGRTLAEIAVDGADVGRALVSEGLARPWGGRRQPWCG